MALNIKDEEVHALAKEIARMTGESLTEVVRRALIERKRGLEPGTGRAAAAAAIADNFARIAKESGVDLRQAEVDLYDEWGLPR
jgi:antitoxin VapB